MSAIANVGTVKLVETGQFQRDSARYWTYVCRALIAAVVLYLSIDALFNREFLKNISDGVGYLDMSHAAAAGHRKALLNAYWSPGYPVVLAIGLAILHPSPARELAAVYGIHWVIGILALWALIYFATGLQTSQVQGRFVLTRSMLIATGCALFLISLQNDVPVYLMTPDLLLASLLWCAGGALLRIGRYQRLYHYAVLAIVLSLAYFTKAVALSLVIAALAVLPFTGVSRRRASHGILLYTAIATILIAPYVTALSKAKGRFTFGESGTLNYSWIVDGADGPNRWHLQNDSPHGHASMHLVHPAQRLMTSPDVYYYPDPVPGTYPVFDDPSYWDDGLRPSFYLQGEVWHVAMNLFHTLTWLATRGVFVVGLVLLLYLQFKSGDRAQFRVILPVLMLFLSVWMLYLLVDIENRYIFGIGTAILLSGAAMIKLRDSGSLPRIVGMCTLVLVCGVAVESLGFAAGELFSGVRQVHTGKFKQARGIGALDNPFWEIAQNLHDRLHLQPNDQVACMQTGCDNTYWASLANTRITADLSREEDYWAAPPDARARAMAVLAERGVKAVVTRHLGAGAESEGWIPLFDPYEMPSQDLFARFTK